MPMKDHQIPRRVTKTDGKTRIVVNSEERWTELKQLTFTDVCRLANLPDHYAWSITYRYPRTEENPGMGGIIMRQSVPTLVVKDMSINCVDTSRA